MFVTKVKFIANFYDESEIYYDETEIRRNFLR